MSLNGINLLNGSNPIGATVWHFFQLRYKNLSSFTSLITISFYPFNNIIKRKSSNYFFFIKISKKKNLFFYNKQLQKNQKKPSSFTTKLLIYLCFIQEVIKAH